jgi:starch-binding outer membrane protein, SusD/RagB family
MKNIAYLILTVPLFFLAGCEDFLEEEPRTFTEPEVLMQSADGVEQAVNGIYNGASRAYQYRYYVMNFGITTDDFYYRGNNSSRRALQNFVFTPTNSNIDRLWEGLVYGVSRANMVLDNFPETGSLGISNEEQFLNYKKGEALFLRGWYYYSLVNAFGEVPLLTKFNDAELFPSNSTIAAIYEQIIADLKEAETLLPNWQDDIHEPGRASRGAAKSLLAKVYLAKATSEATGSSDYQNAANKFKDVIDNEGYGLWDYYLDVFIPANENGKEDIFSYQFEANTFMTATLHADFTPPTNPDGIRGYNNMQLTYTLENAFEPNDERLDMILKGEYIIPSGDTLETPDNRTYTMKHRDPENSPLSHNNLSTNLPFIRYADVLLGYAEALNEVNNGPNQDAYDAINQVRARVELPALSGLSKSEFFDAIVDERFVEFHAEGIRWLDLKRWGLLEEKVEADRPEVDVKPYHYVFPIPQDEIDANPNLMQNEGY